MVSRITRLPLPVDETPVAGWDATIEADADADTATTTSSSHSTSRSLAALAAGRSLRTSIATHALAHEHFVCGIHETKWIHWKTSLAPHRVCQVASNASGTLVAATLDNGTLSILRGTDGTVLATRRVAPEGTRLPACVDFVHSQDSTTSDTLIILPPDDGPPILVSNMQGERLNDVSNPGIVAEAARSMGLHALRLEGCEDIRALQGCTFPDDQSLRLALVDGDGRLAIYDYNVKESTATLINRNVQFGNNNNNEQWEIDLEVGLRIQVVPISSDQTTYFLLFTLYSGMQTKLCWINLQDLTVACEYALSPVQQLDMNKRVRILAIQAVASSSASDALAIALTIKHPQNPPQVETKLIQAVVESSPPFSKVTVKQPHLVYTIPVPPSVQSMAIASVSNNSPFSFLCKTWSGEGMYDCHLFSTEVSSNPTVGSIRLLCAKEQFQEAHNLLIQSQDDSLVKDPFAKFHSSEIAVQRLNRVLDAGSFSSPQALATSQDCLQQIVKGALSGHSLGKNAFLSVADRILNWPDEKAMQNPPFVQEVFLVIEGMIAAMSGVANAFDGSKEYCASLENLQERLQVVKYVRDMLSTNKQPPARMPQAFVGVKNFKDLFASLVQHQYFFAAETLSRSNFRAKLTAESMASSVLNIAPSVKPRLYANLLVQIIFPSLSISHELLPPILAWACKTADALDADDPTDACTDNASSLEDAIFLLESTERATKELRLRIHSSFSIYTPFVEKTGRKRRKLDTSRNASDLSVESRLPMDEQSEGMIGQDVEWQRPNPTILEMARLKGGAQKARVGGQFASIDAVDENEDNVEFKLSSARCLKYARSLGLDRNQVTLGTFFKYGGAQAIAKELVKKFSSCCSSHDERASGLCDTVLPFCNSTGANFDDALISYVQDLCGGKTTTKSAIEEAASVARCATKVGTKCNVTLIALKAGLFLRFSPPWLSQLSKEAIEWAAGDSALRSELEEASRLLLIDGIVGRYCGDGAKELFHVDNPRHAVRLLQFVALHYKNESVLEDSLDLCGAFAHLSREDSCSRILENAILAGDEGVASKLLAALYEKNTLLARATFSRVTMFCIDLIDEEAKTGNTQKMVESLSCAIALTKIALSKIHTHASNHQDGFSTVHFDELALDNLLLDLKRLETLHSDHSVTLPFSALREPSILIKTISKMLSPVVDAYMTKNGASTSTLVTQTKRACSLLSGSCQLDNFDLWYSAVGSSACQLAMQSNGQECLLFMSDLGVFDAANNGIAARSCLAVGLAFCLKASKLASQGTCQRTAMQHIIMALSLLQDHALQRCPTQLLSKTLSVADLCDLVTHVLIRTDEGIGEEMDAFRKRLQGQASIPKANDELISPVHRQPLQPTWYVGDGLLLPPTETLMSGLDFCRQSLRAPTKCESLLHLHNFVDGRGAHGLALRLLSVAVASCISSPEDTISYSGLQGAGKKTVLSLAERYVGGTSNGITSGIVDSQMAVAMLLCLPLKMAFGVYKSSLPTAISTRDFTRVITLANIGTAAGTGKLFPTPTKSLQQWVRQHKFVAQCQELALRAKWWNLLEECGVHFDPNRFQDASQPSHDKTQASTTYVVSLLPSFISSLSRRHADSEIVFKYLIDFADAFGVRRSIAIQRYVAYLLSPPEQLITNGTGKVLAHHFDDIRLKLARLDSTARSILRRLDSPDDRVGILRECLRRLEQPEMSRDYERLSVVLSLYQTELSTLLSKRPQGSITKTQALELELIDRRRDALAILVWYFQNDTYDERPAFSKLFLPLPESWNDDYTVFSKRNSHHVLGSRSENTTDCFDPLQPLDEILGSSRSSAAVAALAPLCLPLGVPRGYIHARSLIARFKKSKQTGAALPSFEDDVLPVLNRLKVSDDVADLAEWCAGQYAFEDEDKLHCLDHALTFAMKASNESELKSSRMTPDEIATDENVQNALERVKRIANAKDVLADRLAINAILNTVDSSDDQGCALFGVLQTLTRALDEKVWLNEDFVPERFVETFIDEASLVASEACLSRRKALSIGQLREFSMLVQRACTALSDKYSHVQVESIARRLSKRWLFHGDQSVSTDEIRADPIVPSRGLAAKRDESLLQVVDEDDTINFIMDLNALQSSSEPWSNEFSTGAILQQQALLTSEEESKLLSDNGSAREVSDWLSRRASLRIAFAMTFVGVPPMSRVGEKPENDENQEPPRNIKKNASKLRSKLSGANSKYGSGQVFEQSRELLRIVFAKSIASGLIFRDLDTSIDSKSSFSSGHDSKQTITFAMRHRALRVAAILCPQDVLQEVIADEDLMNGTHSSLPKATFAAFVAKEIEEMGLPLPHSDLAQLSTMHFPSFARTLWRHHRDGKGSKGRLLSLILEMYLREKVADCDFVASVLDEMEKLKLPRTLLLSLECISIYLKRIGPELALIFLQKIGANLSKKVRSLSEKIIQEFQATKADPAKDTIDVDAVGSALRRVAMIMQHLSLTTEGQSMIATIVNTILGLVGLSKILDQETAPTVMSIIGLLGDEHERTLLQDSAKKVLFGTTPSCDNAS